MAAVNWEHKCKAELSRIENTLGKYKENGWDELVHDYVKQSKRDIAKLKGNNLRLKEIHNKLKVFLR